MPPCCWRGAGRPHHRAARPSDRRRQKVSWPVSEADVTRLREQVAACTRLMVFAEIMDFSGHVSVRIPGTDRILIQPRDTSRSALTADDVLVVDLDNNILEGQGPAPSETALHTCVYRARPDAVSVCHGHPTYSTLFTAVDRPLVPVRSFAYRFSAGEGSGPPIHPDPTHIRSVEQGQAVAATLGQNKACLLRAHGTVVVAPSIEELFMDCLDLEENARSLIMAGGLGTVLPLTKDEMAIIRDSYGRSGYRAGKVWEHYQAKGKQAGVL
jgi:L-ribulose-5-phosphate 4-epimerase